MLITGNHAPSQDGALDLYHSPHTSIHRRIIYINGISTYPGQHKKTALALSELADAEVLGVYNKTDGRGPDLKQCAAEYWDVAATVFRQAAKQVTAGALRVESSILSRVLFAPAINTLGGAAAASLDSVQLRPLSDYAKNPATAALWELLAHPDTPWPSPKICIVAHSQGNLITSTALFMHQYSKALKRIDRDLPIHVYSLASPSPVWPTDRRIVVRTYTYSDDPVTWLSLGRSYADGADVEQSHTKRHEFLPAHDVRGYIRNSQFLRDLRLDLGVAVDSPPHDAAQRLYA